MHHTDGPDVVKVGRARRIDAFITLRQHDQHPGALLHVIDQLDGTLPADGERNDGVWKNDGVADRENR